MRFSENIKFTTFDRDNDSASNNCADQYESGWWYKNCYYCNLNAPYGPNLHWLGTTMSDMKLKEVKMLIRPERSDEEVSN
ncbi:fibrinogen C domain-containing protein 1-like [Drosophila nasuta]|uniref:fibrinogen C domain-containing protein 1-like n=1 Tax=Drosophila nasuta TaxID=42062 RepID=UPI00295F09EB|nr:fibrinogen C domain-containing protein 1-like [Drosophila nasuta]